MARRRIALGRAKKSVKGYGDESASWLRSHRNEENKGEFTSRSLMMWEGRKQAGLTYI